MIKWASRSRKLKLTYDPLTLYSAWAMYRHAAQENFRISSLTKSHSAWHSRYIASLNIFVKILFFRKLNEKVFSPLWDKMLGYFLCHSDDTAEYGVFLFQIWIFNCKVFNLLIVVFILQTLRIVQIFNGIESVRSSVGIAFVSIANEFDADSLVALIKKNYRWVGIKVLRLFEDISFSRKNSNGTYRYEKEVGL